MHGSMGYQVGHVGWWDAPSADYLQGVVHQWGDPFERGSSVASDDVPSLQGMSPPLDSPILSSSSPYPPPAHFSYKSPSLVGPASPFAQPASPTDNIELISSDGVSFVASISALLAASSNLFAGALFPPAAPAARAHLPDPAAVLNVVLHAAYGVSPAPFAPSLAALAAALARLPAYGLDPARAAGPGGALLGCLRAHAAAAPAQAYALAAAHGLPALAAAAAAHRITDVQAREVRGAGRRALLAALLARPPETHAATLGCSAAAQGGMAVAWARAVAHVLRDAEAGAWAGAKVSAWEEADGRRRWNAGAGAAGELTPSALRKRLARLEEGLICAECRRVVEKRLWEVVSDWTMALRSG
ncbi:hypothetical protein HDZ31DRAFT_63832 [Schizophyllum fasciatum]